MLCRPAVNQTSAACRALSREIVKLSTLELMPFSSLLS